MKRPHYAWAVCLGGALSLFSIIGLGINIFSVYQPYIIAQNGFSDAQGSLITTTRSLFTLAAMLTVNQLCARLGLRRVMTLGMGLMVLSCAAFGLAGSFSVYCGAAALTGLAYGYGGMVPLSLAVGHWFRDRRSFALGLAAAGSGVSTIFAPALITRAIEAWGMTAAFLLEGAFILALTLLVWLLVRDSPEALGLQPYHLGGPAAPLPPPRPRPEGAAPALWRSVLLCAFLIGAPAGPGFSHLTMLYTTSGYDSMTVAALLSYLGFMICVGKIVCGQVYDALGGRLANRYTFCIFFAGFLLCCMAPLGGVPLAFAAMTLFGLGLPISAVPFASWAGDLLGDEGYEGAVRSLTVAYALGMLLFGPAAGALADLTGSYVPAYAFFAALLAVSLYLIQRAYRKTGAGLRPAGRRRGADGG